MPLACTTAERTRRGQPEGIGKRSARSAALMGILLYRKEMFSEGGRIAPLGPPGRPLDRRLEQYLSGWHDTATADRAVTRENPDIVR
jgi:hypothetical protein